MHLESRTNTVILEKVQILTFDYVLGYLGLMCCSSKATNSLSAIGMEQSQSSTRSNYFFFFWKNAICAHFIAEIINFQAYQTKRK
jgi:hypothetical protein